MTTFNRRSMANHGAAAASGWPLRHCRKVKKITLGLRCAYAAIQARSCLSARSIQTGWSLTLRSHSFQAHNQWPWRLQPDVDYAVTAGSDGWYRLRQGRDQVMAVPRPRKIGIHGRSFSL